MQTVETELAVVGAGVIGMSVALEMARSGAIVHVVERAPSVAAEASGAGAGILSPRLEVERADPFFELCLDSWRLWIEMNRFLADTTGIDPEHRTRGLLHLAATPDEWALFLRRRARQVEIGIETEVVNPAELDERFPGVTTAVPGAIYYPDEHYLHTDRAMEALYSACRAAGVLFIFDTEVALDAAGARVAGSPPGGARTVRLKAPGLEIAADQIVIAAGAWTGELTGALDVSLPVGPVRGQAAIAAAADACPPCVIYSSDGYVVPRTGGEVYVGATHEQAGFDRNTTDEGIDLIWKNARRLLPALDRIKPSQRWAGLRPCTEDGLPIMGPWPGYTNLLVASGHCRNGILLAPITARIVREWIVNGDPGRDMTAFLPDRFL